jgi:hypothetical protein
MGIRDAAISTHVNPRLEEREVDLQPVTDLVVAAILVDHEDVEKELQTTNVLVEVLLYEDGQICTIKPEERKTRAPQGIARGR